MKIIENIFLKDTIQEAFIPRYTIDGNRKITIVKYLIRQHLEKYIDNRESLLERVYPIKYKLARKLIDGGYKFLGSFGRWCPIKVMQNYNIIYKCFKFFNIKAL